MYIFMFDMFDIFMFDIADNLPLIVCSYGLKGWWWDTMVGWAGWNVRASVIFQCACSVWPASWIVFVPVQYMSVFRTQGAIFFQPVLANA